MEQKELYHKYNEIRRISADLWHDEDFSSNEDRLRELRLFNQKKKVMERLIVDFLYLKGAHMKAGVKSSTKACNVLWGNSCAKG